MGVFIVVVVLDAVWERKTILVRIVNSNSCHQIVVMYGPEFSATIGHQVPVT